MIVPSMGPSSPDRRPSPTSPPPGPLRRLAEIAALGLFAVEFGEVLRRISTSAQGPADLGWILPAALLGVLATDLLSGVVHWLCDNFGDERTPLLGPLLIGPFREHHLAPEAMTQHGLLRVNHNNCVGIAALLGAFLWLTRAEPGQAYGVFGHAFLVGFAGAIYATNTIHRWAHEARPPLLARALQRLGLAIRPAHHARHHLTGRGHYCITTGWLNPLLDRSGVFVALESARRSLRGSGEAPPVP